MDAFAGYLASLVGSWEALAAPHADASVVRGEGFVAARFPSHPVLCNAILLEPAALPSIAGVYGALASYAIWSADHATAAALTGAGWRRDETTVPMRCDLRGLRSEPAAGDVSVDADPGVVAGITGVDEALVRGVPGLRVFASAGRESCVVLIAVGTDVNVSFVATLPPPPGGAAPERAAVTVRWSSASLFGAHTHAVEPAPGIRRRIPVRAVRSVPTEA